MRANDLCRGMCFLFLLSTATHALAADRDLRLIQAARKADKAAVRALVKQGVKINAAEGDGRTALHWAAHAGDLEMVSVLLELGANVNATTDLGITPLWVACTNGSTAVITKLLEAKANPNIAPESDGTPLMLASRTGNTDAVRLLLAHGADPNAKEATRGQTALMWAVAERRPEVVRLLLEKGANVHARSIASRRYVLMCCQDFEGDSAGGDYVDEGGDTPMLFAARVGDIESAKLLLSAGGNIEDAPPTGTSALVLAAHSDQGAFAAFLLDKGANPNADGGGYTALHAAILRSNLDLVKALLSHRANPNVRLMKATPAKRYSGFGFDKRTLGASPFLLATRSGQMEAMRVLAAAGADVNLGLDNGTNPVMAAAMRQVRGGRLAENRVVEAMKLAIELGTKINTPNIDGDTALHFAATRRLDLVVQFLVDSGATVNARNLKGQTALAATLVPVPPAKGAGQATFDEYNFLSSHTAGTAELLRKLGATQ
jgi:ankyrin repeat protein